MSEEKAFCPYCNKLHELTEYYEQHYNDSYKEQCLECSKFFEVKLCIELTIVTNKLICENGGEHNFELYSGYKPDWGNKNILNYLKCVNCGHEERATRKDVKYFNNLNQKP